MEGPTLRRWVRRHGPLSEEQWIPCAAHLTSVLQYLANEGVVHLDVKPSNIVFGLAPRLVDLGIARPFGEARALRDSIGTDAWMAPEQCDPVGAGGVGPAADVWGLGATLYYALTAEPPFPRRSPGEPFPQLLQGPKPLPPHRSFSMGELVERMLRRAPEARPSYLEIADTLQGMLKPRRRRA